MVCIVSLWVPKMSVVPVDLRIRDRLDDVFRILYRLIVGLTRLAVWTVEPKTLRSWCFTTS